MTKLLDQALAAIKKLPEDQQDAIASIILEELADEARWSRAFKQSQDELARIAAAVRAKRRAGTVREAGIDGL